MAHDETSKDEAVVLSDMQHWLEQAVIGLNLCPFAKAVHVRGQIHYVVSHAKDSASLLDQLEAELSDLIAIDPQVRDTTLLMAPWCLESFLDFNDAMRAAQRRLKRLGLVGVIQIAGFHPLFQFAGTKDDDVGNFTNRAPYPTLHLLRETSVDRAVAAFPQAEAIFEHNIETLERLGRPGWDALGVRRTVSSSPGHPEPGDGGDPT
jgi:hypothetical protein